MYHEHIVDYIVRTGISFAVFGQHMRSNHFSTLFLIQVCTFSAYCSMRFRVQPKSFPFLRTLFVFPFFTHLFSPILVIQFIA